MLSSQNFDLIELSKKSITRKLTKTAYYISMEKDLLPANQNGLAKLIESVLNQIQELQAEESLGADKYERTNECE